MSAPPANRPLALVTGASNGIGTEIAGQLASRGYDIIGTGRGHSIDTVAEYLRAQGATVYPLRADLATYDGVEDLWKQVREIGKAGRARHAGPQQGTHPDHFGHLRHHAHSSVRDRLRAIASGSTSRSAWSATAGSLRAPGPRR